MLDFSGNAMYHRFFRTDLSTSLFLLSIACFLGLYFPTFEIAPRGDDWLWLAPAHKLVRDFGVLGGAVKAFGITVGDFWRPLTLLPFLLSPSSLFWSQVLKAMALIGLAWLLMNTARELEIPKWGAFVLASLVLLHQGFVMSVAEPDLWADRICEITLLGLFALGLRYSRGLLSDSKYIFWAAVLTAIALLSKEAGVVCFLTPLIFFFLIPREVSRKPGRGHLFAAAAGLGITLAYLGMRFAAGVTISDGQTSYYGFSVGKNIPFNIGLALLGLLSPVNTVQVALGSPMWRFGAVLWTAFLATLCIRGYFLIEKNEKWRLLAVLAVLFFANQGPVLLMSHITEGNLTRSLPFGLLFVGYCLTPLVERSRHHGWRFAGGIFILWIGFDLIAVHMKINGILTQHQMAAGMRQEVLRLMPNPPPHPVIFLAEAPKEQGYSVFRQPLFTALTQGEIPWGLRDIYHKESLEARLQVVPVREGTPIFTGPYDFFINGKGRVYKTSESQSPEKRIDAKTE